MKIDFLHNLFILFLTNNIVTMFSEVIISRLEYLIGDFDTPFFNYLLYSYDLDLYDCEIIISKIKKDIEDEVISSDDNLVEVIEDYFRLKCIEIEKQGKIEYLAELMDENSEFYKRFLAEFNVSSRDSDIIYDKIKTKIYGDNISDYEIKRDLRYYFSNAVKQKYYIRSLKFIIGDNYDSLLVEKVKNEHPNIHDLDIYQISNELYAEILDGYNFKSIKGAFFDKVMRKSEAKKAEAILKWENLVLGNGDSFNKLLENKHLTIDDGENIKKDVRSKILNGLICADSINGAFLTNICINYSSE